MEYKTDEDEIKIEEHDILSESEIKTEITSGNQECNMELDGAAQGPSVSLSERKYDLVYYIRMWVLFNKAI